MAKLSVIAAVEKAQQAPHLPWSLIEVTEEVYLQSREVGAETLIFWTLSAPGIFTSDNVTSNLGLRATWSGLCGLNVKYV